MAKSVRKLAYCNPFVPDRVEHEQAVLGDAFVPVGAAWYKQVDEPSSSPNIGPIAERVEKLSNTLRERLVNGRRADDDELELYENLVLYLLYERYQGDFLAIITETQASSTPGDRRLPFYGDFSKDLAFYLAAGNRELPGMGQPAHVFACFYQLRRAFHHIFDHLIGGSMAAARLRAEVWQSIFTHDMARYRRVLYKRMGDITTLVTGASGTGKELVARAIGLSRYIPFDPGTKTFASETEAVFHPINLAALSSTLVESELFGHRRGAFTGAVADHDGWFDACGPLGTVFLDEIGDVDPGLQVKLLRVLETRAFQRIGDTQPRRFSGKIIAATNRDLFHEMQAGRIRQDFYYRLCSDIIVAPSLKEQLHESPEQLHNLVLHLAKRLAGEDEAEELADDVGAWINQNLRADYPWPGNVRELEQCVRNVLIRQAYYPSQAPPEKVQSALAEAVCAGSLTADELMRHYCTLVYAQAGTYQEAARRLRLDHRTVKDKIDPDLLQRYR